MLSKPHSFPSSTKSCPNQEISPQSTANKRQQNFFSHQDTGVLEPHCKFIWFPIKTRRVRITRRCLPPTSVSKWQFKNPFPPALQGHQNKEWADIFIKFFAWFFFITQWIYLLLLDEVVWILFIPGWDGWYSPSVVRCNIRRRLLNRNVFRVGKLLMGWNNSRRHRHWPIKILSRPNFSWSFCLLDATIFLVIVRYYLF